MTEPAKFPPDDAGGDLKFSDTKVNAPVEHSHAYSPDASASTVLFTGFTGDAQGVGAVSAMAATVAMRMQGSSAGRVKIDVRGAANVTADARALLTVLDGNERHEMVFTRRDAEIFMSWTRRVKPGEYVQLSVFAMCRTLGTEAPGGMLTVDSIDMASLSPKK